MAPISAALSPNPEQSGAVGSGWAWLEIGVAPRSLLLNFFIGIAAAGLAVALGIFLTDHTGGGEPLMAVFPILLVVCVRWGSVAGAVTLVLGVIGAWYVYLGQPYSLVITGNEARSLLIASVVGVLIIAVCSSLRANNIRLRQATTAQEAMAAGLAQSEAQFRASFENAAVGKAQSDPITGRIMRVNQAFADMLGYTVEDMVGRDAWEFTLDEDLDAERAEFQRLLDGETDVYVREKRYLRKDGQAIWGRVSATVTRSPATGKPTLAVAVIENIDEQYKSRIALEVAARDLERLLAEQTSTIAQRDVLLREVYHRVKNNLQVVDSLLVMQRRQLTDPDAREALAGLRSRVFALGLVHHQLMGSRDLQTFDVGPFLEDLSCNLLSAGVSKAISLSVRAIPLKVGLDFAIPLGLIVTELVTNSLKHGFPDGTGNVEVELKRAAAGRIALVVSDNGTAPGTDVGASRQGDSLGMTIVDALVRQLDGVMAVQSGPGFRTEIQLAEPTGQ